MRNYRLYLTLLAVVVYTVTVLLLSMPIMTFISVEWGEVGLTVLLALLASVLFITWAKKHWVLVVLLAITFAASLWGIFFSYRILPGLM